MLMDVLKWSLRDVLMWLRVFGRTACTAAASKTGWITESMFDQWQAREQILCSLVHSSNNGAALLFFKTGFP